MSAALQTTWSFSLLAEATLLTWAWIKLRQQYSWFVLYLFADLVWALFMFGVWKTVPRFYAEMWIAFEVLLVGVQFFVSFEAVRRMSMIRRFTPGITILALIGAAGCSVYAGVRLDTARKFPESWLESVNMLCGSMEIFWGVALWLLFALPCRDGSRWRFESKHALILAAYLFVSGILMFKENREMSLGSSVPGWVFMVVNIVAFAVWIAAVSRKKDVRC